MSHADADINIKPSAIELSPTSGGRRTFFNRTFGKLEKGSVRGSIFNMISAAMGGGVLSLPFVFVLSGYGIGLILIAGGCIGGIWSNVLIAKMATTHKLGNLD